VFGDPVIFFDNPQWTNVGGYSYWRMPTDGSFLIRVDKQPTTTRELRVVEGWKNIR
jgi:hypothetical protein